MMIGSYIPTEQSFGVIPYQYKKRLVPAPRFASDLRVYGRPGFAGLSGIGGGIATAVIGGALLLGVLWLLTDKKPVLKRANRRRNVSVRKGKRRGHAESLAPMWTHKGRYGGTAYRPHGSKMWTAYIAGTSLQGKFRSGQEASRWVFRNIRELEKGYR